MYGVALGYTFVQALEAAGKNLTRQGLLNAIASKGSSFITPGLVPLSYSSSVHYGYEGAEVVQFSTTAPPIMTPTGSSRVTRHRFSAPARTPSTRSDLVATRKAASADPTKVEDPTGVLPSPGTRCAEHTWGSETNPETTEGDSRGTATHSMSASTCTGGAA